MSYRLDPSSNRFILTSDSSLSGSRVSRLDDRYQSNRIVTENSAPHRSGQIIRSSQVRLQPHIESRPVVVEKQVLQNSRVGESRQEAIENLKSQLTDLKSEATKLVSRQDSTASTRRIVLLNNGRRVFDPDSVERMSNSGDTPNQQIAPTIIREPISKHLEPKILTRDNSEIFRQSNDSLYEKRDADPVVRDFGGSINSSPPAPHLSFVHNSPMSSQLEQYNIGPGSPQPPNQMRHTAYVLELQKKVRQLQQKFKHVRDERDSLNKDQEIIIGDLTVLRRKNSDLQMNNALMRQLEIQFNNLRTEADNLFEQNTNLKNELSAVKSQLQHATLLRSDNNTVIALQEQNSNLKSELQVLKNRRQQTEMILAELNNMREVQQENGRLRTQIFLLKGLQSEVSGLKSELSSANTQISILNNQLTMERIKSGSVENETKIYLETLNGQLQKLQSDLAVFENMKRNLEFKFGYTNIPVDEFVQKVYMMLNDNMAMSEELQMKDSQLDEFRDKMEQNQKAIEQLTLFRRGYEENLKSINAIHDADRQKLMELTRLLEENRIALKESNDELLYLKDKYRPVNPMEDDNVVRFIKNKDVEITKLQVELKNTNVKVERLERELQQEKINMESRLSSEKKQMSNNYEFTIKNISHELQVVISQAHQLEAELIKANTIIENLSMDLGHKNETLAITTEKLQITTNDLNRMSELYGLKEREMEDLIESTQKIESEYRAKIDQVQNDLQIHRMRLDCRYEEQQQYERELRRELEDTRNNWHRRLLHELRNFDEGLKEQIEQLNQLKRLLAEKEEKIIGLKDNLFSSQSFITALKTEVEIEKLKGIGERKTQQVAFEVEIQALKNDLAQVQKVAELLDQKLKQVSEDSRKKDEFIQKYLMGKRPEEKLNIEAFFKQYEALLPREGSKAKIEQEILKIEQLHLTNRALSQELARMKGLPVR